MKRKLLSLLLIGVMVLGLTGCGSNGGNKYSIGDKVSTDLVDFTIETSKLTLAVDSEGAPQNYDDCKNCEYIASKGHVYASFTLIINNLDRSKLEIDNDFITAKYNGKESNSVKIISSSEDLAKWDSSSKVYLDAGKELTYRGYIEIDSDAKDLNDDFDLIVELPKSDGSKEKYSFTITKSARDNAKIREITLDTAINRYPLKASADYLKNHLAEFEVLNGTQITELVQSNNGDHYLKIGSGDYKHHEFTEMKSSGNNLIIWPGGTGASSFMYDVGVWSVEGDILKVKSSEYKVRKLNDKNYLLTNKSDSILGLMH